MDPRFNEPLKPGAEDILPCGTMKPSEDLKSDTDGTFYECHGHLMMDGSDYTAAKNNHAEKVCMETVRKELEDLRSAGVVYFRDGGDALGVGKAARPIAPEYGIEYSTPVFAIHKRGRYGWIVGRSFETIGDYRQRLEEVGEERGDFVKLIVSGIITFSEYGGLSCPSLEKEEIRELIHISHEEGYAVMIHVNGAEAIRACVEAGADSIEHAYFADEETLECIAGHKTIWVPTIAATEAFVGRKGFDEEVAAATVKRQMEAVRKVAEMYAAENRNSRGCPLIAAGSDSGAVGVPHGAGTVREYDLLVQSGLERKEIECANRELRRRFRR